MGAFLEFVSAVQAWVGYFVAPHRFSVLMLASAVAWGYAFCAPAFKDKGRK